MTERATRDRTDRDLRGEDLTEGPTPQTRKGADDIADLTEGPTPETRAADRREEIERGERPHASGQPEADRETRKDIRGDKV